MSQKRDRIKARGRKRWHEVMLGAIADVRSDLGLEPDEQIPDAVLLAEVDHYLTPTEAGRKPDYRIEPRKWWLFLRLVRAADSEADRIRLASHIWPAGHIREGQPGSIPWGFGPIRASRRSPGAGRRRNLARRST